VLVRHVPPPVVIVPLGVRPVHGAPLSRVSVRPRFRSRMRDHQPPNMVVVVRISGLTPIKLFHLLGDLKTDQGESQNRKPDPCFGYTILELPLLLRWGFLRFNEFFLKR